MAKVDIVMRARIKRGKQLLTAGRYQEARSVYKNICAKKRDDADSWFTLGVINGLLNRYDDAIACFSRAVELVPGHAAAWCNLGIALRDSGSFKESANALQRALNLDLGQELAATNLGYVLIELHRYDEVKKVSQMVQKFQPKNLEFHVVCGSAMQKAGRYEAAISAYKKAVDGQYPAAAEVYENMGAALCLQGRYQEAIDAGRMALELEPQNARLHSGLLLTYQYLVDKSAESIFEQHQKWVGNLLGPEKPGRSIHLEFSKRLRVGYVSSDFRRHSVAYFVEPLLEHHDAGRYEITCYFTNKEGDDKTKQLRALSHRWRNVAGLDDSQFLQVIADDGIDILVDLSGHTSGGRLTVFARRAAPVQVSFIGYPCTTGVKEMDYRISDEIADPLGAERWCTESLYRLPRCFLCYRPPVDSPQVSRLPMKSKGFVTFGSFNNLAKINREVILLWAELLKRLPMSRLVIKNHSLTDKPTRERYQKLFLDVGVSDKRIEFTGFIPDNADHLATYGKIDIALDTFPYNGTTTTCEALWMGVPVVSLSGDRHSARVGASLLEAVGFPDWVADTSQQYLQIAQDLAEDMTALDSLRHTLRQHVRCSHLCQGEMYTREVEAAYESMISGQRK